MPCLSSKAITAPLVITFDCPGVHCDVSAVGSANRQANVPSCGWASSWGAASGPAGVKPDGQVAELGQELLQAERAAGRHGEVDGRPLGQGLARGAEDAAGAGGHGEGLGAGGDEGGGGHEGQGRRVDLLPGAGHGGGERGHG